MKYDIVTTNGKNKFIEMVNEKLNDGWVLQGGVSVLHAPGTYTIVNYSQAITFEDKI